MFDRICLGLFYLTMAATVALIAGAIIHAHGGDGSGLCLHVGCDATWQGLASGAHK